ncbi:MULTISPECIES: hypothetical protein [Rhizobium]|uniref:hypothetical protein n=1 Tax=Rhizobium TaxID=379 RepID=UPI000462DC62|nr:MULTISPECIES: hypothetical protein [Rhizobium]MCS0460406.1 hypothetical protein [Rhizobium favelukesii]UFS80791.1 hypothetical protein LPB79_20765 [Rhizobium sp. T136]
MAVDFDAIIERQLKDDFPAKLHRFLKPQPNPSAFERTWSYYSFAYEVAFETMARDYCQRYPAQEYLLIPMTNLARHSMELSLKYALTECSFFANRPLKIEGHSLLVLNDRLDKFLIEEGLMEGGDGWNEQTRRVLVHIDNVDKSGEAFRYPADLAGNRFDPLLIDVEGLIAAHHHITTLADATVTMLQETGACRYDSDYR